MGWVKGGKGSGGSGGSSFASYPADILALNPYLYWEAQDPSGNLSDSSGNTRTGVAAGTAASYHTVGPGNQNGITPFAVQFGDATTAFAGGTPNLQNNFAIELWLFASSSTTAQILTSANVGGNNFTAQTASGTNMTWNVTVQGVAVLATAANIITLNQWHQIVIAKASGSGGIWKYWFDGVQDTANAGTAAPGAAQTGSFQINGAAGWRQAHISVIPSYFPSNAQVWKRYVDMNFGPG